MEAGTTLGGGCPVPLGKPGWRLQDNTRRLPAKKMLTFPPTPQPLLSGLGLCGNSISWPMLTCEVGLDPTHCTDEETEAQRAPLDWEGGIRASGWGLVALSVMSLTPTVLCFCPQSLFSTRVCSRLCAVCDSVQPHHTQSSVPSSPLPTASPHLPAYVMLSQIGLLVSQVSHKPKSGFSGLWQCSVCWGNHTA